MKKKYILVLVLLLTLALVITGCNSNSGKETEALKKEMEELKGNLKEINTRLDNLETLFLNQTPVTPPVEAPVEEPPTEIPSGEISEKYDSVIKALEKHELSFMEADASLIGENDDLLVQYFLEETPEDAKSFFDALISEAPEEAKLEKINDYTQEGVWEDVFVAINYKDKAVVMTISKTSIEAARVPAKDLGMN